MTGSPFDHHPGFYADDNRQHRMLSPVTRESLENKHAAIFAEWNVEGKTILDLGSALGASGQWLLWHGASHYTGVEAQAEYARLSGDLLAHHGERVDIVQDSVDSFLAANERSYDIVLMLGIIYSFLNQYELLRDVTAICDDVLVIEGLYPDPKLRCAEAPIVEICSQHTMAMADANESMYGVGARITPAALEVLLNTLGFESSGKLVQPKQLRDCIDNYQGDPNQHYLVKYIQVFRNSGKIQRALTDYFNKADFSAADRTPWNKWEDKREYVDPQRPVLAEKEWEFDDGVADRFAEEARANIPDYDRVIERCLEIAEASFDREARIVDVGSAVGGTLQSFWENGYRDLHGIDSSQAMIDRAFRPPDDDIHYVCAESFPTGLAPVSMVTANWTLHFVGRRRDYLRDIHAGLQLGGLLVLTDKTLASDLVGGLYDDFKRRQGLSDEYIAYKTEALKEVLVPYPLDWYLTTLREIGFRSVEIVNAAYCFTTFLARK